MKIGFDAKRALFNRSGLGNYSRNTIRILHKYFPENEYTLFTPSLENAIQFINTDNITTCLPRGKFNKIFKSYWRSYNISQQLLSNNIELYHGLSNELPLNIHKNRVRSVVTIHDLIFLRHPHLYKPADRFFYKRKSDYCSKNADIIIAISEQTKSDLINYLKTPKEKIIVVYQGCDPIFYKKVPGDLKNAIKEKYHLPSQYILQVGTIEERKNLLSTVKAIKKGKINIPLVVIGKSTKYAGFVKKYISENQIENIHFLHNVVTEDLPAIYQMANVFIYPSVFEGFGIPILEAIASKTPVITTREGCFKEAGGESSIYIDPLNIEQLTDVLIKVLSDSKIREQMVKDGYDFAQNFREDILAKNLIDVYNQAVL